MNILGFNDGLGMTLDSQTDDHDDEKSQRRRQIQKTNYGYHGNYDIYNKLYVLMHQNAMFILPPFAFIFK